MKEAKQTLRHLTTALSNGFILSVAICLNISLILVLLGCAPRPGVIATPSPKARATATPTPRACLKPIVVDVVGVATREKPGQEPQAVRVGMTLDDGDVIRTSKDSEVKILYPKNPPKRVGPNSKQTIDYCRDLGYTPEPIEALYIEIYGEIIRVPPPQLLEPPYQPFIISPGPQILAERPLLIWMPVEGADKYTVIIAQAEGEVWRRETTEPLLVYPETAPDLVPETPYYLRIQAWAGLPDQLELLSEKETQFLLLNPAKAQQIHMMEQKIKELGWDEPSTHFMMGTLYLSAGLHSEAIAQFESLVKIHPEPLFYQLLGNAYLEMGLPPLALEQYEQALNLSQQRRYRESEAAALTGIGSVKFAYGDFDEALKDFESSLMIYQEIGDKQRVGTMLDIIMKTEKQLPGAL